MVITSDLTKEERLIQAREHCFFIGINDSGCELCKANSVYGLAAIQYLQEAIGLRPDATFITCPDMTITRNTSRWKSGFGYGGKVSWGSGSDEFVVLNAKPNACGMLVGGLESLPDVTGLIRRLHDLEQKDTFIDGVKVEWDFCKSNHFIDIFRVKEVVKGPFTLPPYAFIIHGSAGEFTGDNPLGFGLYYDKSPVLMKMAEKMETPFGPFYYLTGNHATAYLKQFKTIDVFARKKREEAARILFGEYLSVSNECHQGMINLNEILLGSNMYQAGKDILFPLTLRGDLPAYLVRGLPSLTPGCVEALGFEKRARKLGVYERLINANIFPHGGGYTLPDLLNVNRILEIDQERYFDVEMQNDRGKKIISDLRALPFEYRGRMVVLRSLEIGLIEIVAKLIPQFILKM